MSLSMGPHLPKAGWQKRWVLQSLQLAGRAPAAFVVLLASAALIGALTIVLAALFLQAESSSLAVQSIMALSAVLALPLRVLVGNFIMRADARGWRDLSDVMAISRTALPFVVGVEIAMLALDLLFGFGGGGKEGGAAPALGMAEATLRFGVVAFCAVEMTLWVWNPLWVGTMPALHIGAGEANKLDSLLRQKSLRFWLTLMVVQYLVRSVVLQLPTLMGLGLLFLNCIWIYVAAREVIGGIDDNGIEETAAQPQTA